MLLSLMKTKPIEGFVFTSNIDSHFIKSGFNPSKINECHGSISYLQCSFPKKCKNNKIWETPKLEMKVDNEEKISIEDIPICNDCGKVARPSILMFGDSDWIGCNSKEQNKNFL